MTYPPPGLSVYPPRRPVPQPWSFLLGALACWLLGLGALGCGGWTLHEDTTEAMGWAAGILMAAGLLVLCLAGFGVATWLYGRARRYRPLVFCVVFAVVALVSFAVVFIVALRSV